MSNNQKIKVGITVGDVNGIGLEVIIKTLLDPRITKDVTPILYGSSKVLSYHRKAIGVNDFSVVTIDSASESNSKKINLVNCWEEDVKIELGKATSLGGKYAYLSLEKATQDLASNKIDVLVTAPINKNMIQTDSFRFPGHTEYLANMSNVDEALMMMVYENLRVGVLTAHIPLSEVPSKISTENISSMVKKMNQSLLRDFGIIRPKIAVLGVNPHAGEGGLLGEEETNVIAPTIAKLREQDILAFGPFPADGFFGSNQFTKYDGVLAMYHDQGLAPFKAMAFDQGVNFTAGLPIVRTSPDHGTAYDLAGKNLASESSFRNALYLAKDVYENRKNYKEIHANPLKSQNVKEGATD